MGLVSEQGVGSWFWAVDRVRADLAEGGLFAATQTGWRLCSGPSDAMGMQPVAAGRA